MVIIPTYQSTSARYSIEVELEDVTYTLDFHWNSRDSAWYMDIEYEDSIILAGIKLVPKYALLHQYAYLANLPDGEFFIIDSDDDNPYAEDLTFDNFGDRYLLLFIPNSELEES